MDCRWNARKTWIALELAVIVSFARAQSPYPGMGAIPVSGGVSFRVWAPHATGVNVRGAFNSWGMTNPLNSEGASGLWSGVVAGARAGDAYKFFITNSAPVAPNSTTAWRRDPYSRQLVPYIANDSNSVVYDTSAFDWGTAANVSVPSLNKLIIYEMHIGSFNAPAGTPATFSQAAARLDNVAALGVNAIEVMPLHENPTSNGWGYDPTLLDAIKHGYGGPDAFKAFVKACHQRGIIVLVDIVYNHAGSTANDMWDFDLWEQGTGGGIWFFNDANNRDTPWGPRYNYTAPQVQDLLLGNIRMCLDEFRVDGFRFDATGVMRKSSSGATPGAAALLQQITQTVHSEYPGKLCIAEDWDSDLLATAPPASGGLGFDTEWTGFFGMIARLLSAPDAARDLDDLTDFLTETYNGGAFTRVIYSESHDTAAPENPPYSVFPFQGAYLPARINQVDPETNAVTLKLSMIGGVLTLTAPGVPMLLMGQELYETGVFDFPSPPAMAWAALEAAHPGIPQLYHDLIALRLNSGGATGGLLGSNIQVFHQNTGAHVVAYWRYDKGGPGDDVVVLLNLSATDFSGGYILGVPETGVWKVRFNSDLTTYDSRFGSAPGTIGDLVAVGIARDGLPAQLKAPKLPPYSALILSQEPPPPAQASTWISY